MRDMMWAVLVPVVALLILSVVIYFVYRQLRFDKMTNAILKQVGDIEKTLTFADEYKQVVDMLVDTYNSGMYSPEEMIARKNYLQRSCGITDLFVSTMLGVFTTFSTMTLGEYFGTLVPNNYSGFLGANLFGAVITLMIIVILMPKFSEILMHKEFNRYNTNDIEVALIDKCIANIPGTNKESVLNRVLAETVDEVIV